MTNHAAAHTTRTVNTFKRAINRLRTPLLAIASAIFLSALLLPAPAMAQAPDVCTPTGSEVVTANQATYVAGATVQFTGIGYGHLCSVALDVYVPDGTVDRATITTDATGKFSSTYPLGSVTGRYIFNVMEVGDQVQPASSRSGRRRRRSATRLSTKRSKLLQNYLPGDTVNVTGSGFAPSCEVLMAVNAPDGTQNGDR